MSQRQLRSTAGSYLPVARDDPDAMSCSHFYEDKRYFASGGCAHTTTTTDSRVTWDW